MIFFHRLVVLEIGVGGMVGYVSYRWYMKTTPFYYFLVCHICCCSIQGGGKSLFDVLEVICQIISRAPPLVIARRRNKKGGIGVCT